ncbi:hypothetical protein OG894_41970 (plasmid) [Streptomyces sp. NBC_01724]|uniref:hypothetical protein n=1 Tax=Streptomyces sp. NBC_01724 TaxID=2975922 RepID=UPI002E349144|nr:hypothetical protein [Streptomyces sp. NBC_01724]
MKELHELYTSADRPGLRTIAAGIAEDTDERLESTINFNRVGQILSGRVLPRLHETRSLAWWFARRGGGSTGDAEAAVRRLTALWHAADPLGQNSPAAPAAAALPTWIRPPSAEAVADLLVAAIAEAGERAGAGPAWAALGKDRDRLADLLSTTPVNRLDATCDVLEREVYYAAQVRALFGLLRWLAGRSSSPRANDYPEKVARYFGGAGPRPSLPGPANEMIMLMDEAIAVLHDSLNPSRPVLELSLHEALSFWFDEADRPIEGMMARARTHTLALEVAAAKSDPWEQ